VRGDEYKNASGLEKKLENVIGKMSLLSG